MLILPRPKDEEETTETGGGERVTDKCVHIVCVCVCAYGK